MTEHFSFDELTNTTHLDLVEQNREAAKLFLKQLKYIAATLEEIRSVINVPIKVSSGFRSAALNKRVGGSPTSGHTKGLCADIVPIGMSVSEACKMIVENKHKCPSLKKCILEKVKGSEWLHIETKTEREQPQKFYYTKNGKTYTEISSSNKIS